MISLLASPGVAYAVVEVIVAAGRIGRFDFVVSGITQDLVILFRTKSGRTFRFERG
jgi:hypothetical protein